MYILIGADIVPTDRNEAAFSSGDIGFVFGEELHSAINNAEFRIANIEAPITDIDAPISKCGPNLRIPRKCINGFSAMHIDLASLANNHIMDQGEDGLSDTCRELLDAGIQYIGVGEGPNDIKKTHTFSFNGKRIGVLSCVEHEFSVVSKKSAGANPFDPFETPEDVAHLKDQCDYVIVLYHGGIEQYRYPSPQLQVVCRKLVEKGANLVVCQHSHCIGCEEAYHNGRIVYGQGNFMFTLRDNDYWNSGLLIKINDDLSITYIPTIRNGAAIRMAQGEEADEIMGAFYHRSEEIKSDSFIQESYERFANNRMLFYLKACYPKKFSIMSKVLNKVLGGRYEEQMLKKMFGNRETLRLYNYIYCESHRELFIQALKNRANIM